MTASATAVTNCTEAKTLCPKFMQTFAILGKKWNGLIIETLLQQGPARFKDIAGAITKCSDRVLVERLKELEGEGLINRVTHKDSALIEYVLTPKGESLAPVMAAAHTWGDTWISEAECQ